jgi:hypothetical protein
MADLVRLHRRGDRLLLESHHLTNRGHDEKTSIGLAIDLAEKERAAVFGATIPDRHAPYDYYLGGHYYDIKSSRGKWLSISYRELEFAKAQVAAGKDVFYAIFLQLDGNLEYEFLGYVSFKAIEPVMMVGTSPFWSLSAIKNNLL